MSRNPVEEIEALMEERHRPRCKVSQALEWVSADLKPGLEDALADKSMFSNAIAKWLSREGFQISERSVQRHRGGNCGCS